METALVAVVVFSLAVALTMTLVTWRLVREERRRSAARVAALMAERSHSSPAEVTLASDWRRVSSVARAETERSPHVTPEPRHAGDRTAGVPRTPLDESVQTAQDLFTPMSPHPSGLGYVAMAAATVLVAVGIGVAWRTLSGPEVAPVQPVEAEVLPLELLSLTYSRSNDLMAISGSVRNPEVGEEIRRVTAVAVLFDRASELVNTGSAPLDFTTLAPGEESPFVITVPATRAVARYRISFRREDDSVMPHVDRRESPPRPQGLVAGRETGATR